MATQVDEPAVEPSDAGGPPIEAPPAAVGWVRMAALATATLCLGLIVLFFVRATASVDGLDPRTNGGALVPILVAAVGLIGAVGTLVARPERLTVPALSATAAVWSLALLAGLVGLWIRMAIETRPNAGAGVPIRSPVEVRAQVAVLSARDPAAPPPILIPTGVLVQSIEFATTTDVEVTGYVWQVYGPGVPKEIAPGFVVPDAVAGGFGATEAFRFTRSGLTFVGWHLDVTLRQPFSYQRYPFDRQDVILRLWHKDTPGRVLQPGSDLSLARLRKMVVFDRLIARRLVVAPDRWVVKGGVALDLRLGDRARTTKDLDLARQDGEE